MSASQDSSMSVTPAAPPSRLSSSSRVAPAPESPRHGPISPHANRNSLSSARGGEGALGTHRERSAGPSTSECDEEELEDESKSLLQTWREWSLSRWWKKIRPRQRQWCFCLIAETVIIAALLTQFFYVRHSMAVVLHRQAASQVRLMTMTYNRKVQDLALLSKTWAMDEDLIDYVKGTNSSRTYDDLRSMIKYDLDYLAVEYGTVFDANGKIVLDINFNRTGIRDYDPEGAVSRVLAHPHRGVVHLAGLVDFEELDGMQCPVYRESFTHLLDNDITHPFDTAGKGLMRYVVQPLFEHANGTGRSIGAILTGDLTNGKTPITYLVTEAFSQGFSGLYTDDGKGGWVRSSSSVYLPTTEPDVEGAIVSKLDPLKGALKGKLLDQAAKNPGEIVHLSARGFIFAAMTAPPGTWNSTELQTEVPPAVMVRGLYFRNDTTVSRLLLRTWFYAAALLVVIAMSVYFSSSSFIAPLEKLAIKLKNKTITAGKLKMDDLSSLDLYAKFLFGAIVTVVITVACSAMIAVNISAGIRVLLQQVVLGELGVAEVAYNEQIIQMSHLCRSLAHSPTIRQLAASPNDHALQNKTSQILGREILERQMEYLVVVNRDRNIVGTNNLKNLYVNFDPVTLATMTMEEHLLHKYTAPLSYSEFVRLQPTIMQRHLFNDAPDSKLTPYTTGLDPFARWASSPIYRPDNTDRNHPDAAILAGDIINGKTAVAEQILKVTGEGYVGMFAQFDDGTIRLLNSFLVERNTQKTFVDLAVPTDVVRKSILSQGDTESLTAMMESGVIQVGTLPDPAPVLGTATIRGKKYVLAAIRVTMNRMIQNGDEVNDANYPKVYIVYGKDTNTTKAMEQHQYIWVFVTSILQILMMMMLNYTAYLPFGKLMRVLQSKGFVQGDNKPTAYKVFVAYIVKPIKGFFIDLATKPAATNYKVYIADPWRNSLKRYSRPKRNKHAYSSSVASTTKASRSPTTTSTSWY